MVDDVRGGVNEVKEKTTRGVGDLKLIRIALGFGEAVHFED